MTRTPIVHLRGGACILAAFLAFMLSAPRAGAQTLDVPWYTVDCGGTTSTGTSSGGTVFAVTGTVGQPDAGPGGAPSGGIFAVIGGFWSGAIGAGPPPCGPDFDHNGSLQVADIFAFLNAWFAGNVSADYDGIGGLQVADIFAFLNAWFAGCN